MNTWSSGKSTNVGPECGVTAIPLPGAPGVDVPFVCDHDGCPAAGTVVG
jgi:hypothetical protein